MRGAGLMLAPLMGFLDPTDPSHTPGSLILRRLMMRGTAVFIAGVCILIAPSVERWWAKYTSECAKLLTAEDLVAIGGKQLPLESAYHCEYFCDANYGYSAFVDLNQDTYHSDNDDQKWLEEAKKDGATVETLVEGSAWLALDGKDEHSLIIKREFGAAKIRLKTKDFSADQARKLYPLVKDRFGPVDAYFAAK